MIARVCIAIVLAGSWLIAPSRAEAPKVEGLFPAGGQRGTQFDVTASGKLDPWPVQARCDDGGVVFSPGEKAGAYRVTIAEDVQPGAKLVRFFNADGATVPRQFVVGEVPERLEAETSDTPLTAAAFPLTINGILASGGEIDRFTITLDAGQTLVADVAAYALDSPLDPVLHVRGLRGEQLAFNHDATRLGLDPRLVFTAPAAGTYELHLSAFAYPPRADIRFTGGSNAVYRLSLRRSPPRLDLPPPFEVEGDDPQTVDLPAAVSGTIASGGDVDRFRFVAKKGDFVRIEVAAAAFGSWMDPALVITDVDGKELKSDDDIDPKANPDVDLTWAVPADGDYIAAVRDVNGASGAEIGYRLCMTRPVPSIAATADGGVWSVAPGKSAEVAVRVARRNGFEGSLEVSADDLPPGVAAEPAAVGDTGEATLTLTAAADAPPANGPFTIWAGPKETPGQRVAAQFQIKGATTDPGDLLINQTPHAWLTIPANK